VNAAAVGQYGYSREEFTNMTLQDIPVAEQWLSVRDVLCANTSSANPRKTWQHRTKSGDSIEVDMIWAPLSLNDRDARLVIVQDVTERLKLQAAEQKEQMRRLLLERTLQVQEEERRRIARELHDEAGQLMTSLLVGLRSLRDVRRLEDAKKQAKRMREIASEAIGELSRLALGLHSSILEDLGLEAAIRRYADEFSAMHHIELELELTESELSSLTENEHIHVYRIIQEALTNVARHSQADRVSIKFRYVDAELLITIRDNGLGFSPSCADQDPSHHLGIEGMRERAGILGGTLGVVSVPQEGVTVHLRLPVRHPSASKQSAEEI
jgi:PAS domain S-box-containing protein